MSSPAYDLEFHDSISAVPAADWNRLVGDGSPFVEHAWLAAMEASGTVGPGTGWTSYALTAKGRDGRLVGAVPLYLKSHSFGEYVYDWAWADVAARIGAGYYPKIVSASPFSPVTGPRVLVDGTLDAAERGVVFDALVSATLELARDNGVHGVHFLFVDREASERLSALGLIVRHAHQYHWHDDGYADFDDFLGRFRSKKRREIRRERRRLAEAGYTVEPVAGVDLTDAQLDDVFRFYATTCARHMWGRRYLEPEFFRRVHATMPSRLLVMLARDPEGTTVGGTFSLTKGDRIWGRYWGADREVPFLHFETCYYRTIEYALAHGIRTIEPGAGGDHKYVRGFEPVTMYSAHWIEDRTLRALLRQATDRESQLVDESIEHMVETSPIRR